MERIAYTFGIMRASWNVLVKDKELLLYPLVSGVCCLLVLASFALPMMAVVGDEGREALQARVNDNPVLYYGLLFLYYFITYAIIIFCNAAVVACAIFRLRGGDPTLKTGFRASLARLPQILGWALLAATVGIILRMIEDRSRRVGAIVAGLLGMAWSVVTFLVVPVLVVEQKGPVDALKESARLLKKTWGDQLVGQFSFGVIFMLFGLIAIAPGVVGALALARGAIVLGIGMLAVAVGYLVLLGLVQATLQTIFQAAVYLYAREGRAPRGFTPAQLGGAMAAKS